MDRLTRWVEDCVLLNGHTLGSAIERGIIGKAVFLTREEAEKVMKGETEK